MLREALLATAAMGAGIEVLRLTDLNIKPCRGCLACVFKSRCSITDDDFGMFLGKVREADGLIVAAPTYILSPAGVIKIAIDRCLNILPYTQEPGRRKRHAALISVAGGETFNPLGREFLSLFAMSYGFQVVDHMEAYAQGPGEVLLEDGNITRAAALGRNLCRSLRGEFGRMAAGVSECPICYSRTFRIRDDGRVECPFCLSRGRLVPMGGQAQVVFDPESLEKNFGNWEHRMEHIETFLQPSRSNFRERRRLVEEKAVKYALDPIWPNQ